MDSIADEAVVATNEDAAVCKYQTILKGYYSDPYLDMFLTNKMKTTMTKKAPEINRGYFARSVSIAYIVQKFLDKYPNGQIISLGAGYDTLFWRLKDASENLRNIPVHGDEIVKGPLFRYVEIDMSSVVVHKILAVKRHLQLHNCLGEVRYKGEGLHSDTYNLVASDLRQVNKEPLQKKLLEDCGIETGKPTLCLAECVLVYMPLQDSNSLISWLSSTFSDLVFVNYEQCNMVDRFGEIMLENMVARHCDLMGVEACKSLDTQIERFKQYGLNHTKGWTLLNILNDCLLPSEIERVYKIEFLDEKELLTQLLEHYCIVIGSHNAISWLPEGEYWTPLTRHK